MSAIEFHSLAELFPLMDGAEFDALVEDISKHGLREPIVLFENKILDGRNRYRACTEAEIQPTFEQWNNGDDPRAYVVSKNLHRRHLNASQRAMVAAQLVTTRAGENQYSVVKAIDKTTLDDAAGLLNVSSSLISKARTVIERGTPEEVRKIEVGAATVDAVVQDVRKRSPRKQIKKEPRAQVGKNPERIQRRQVNAEIWGRIRDALNHLTSLPLPADVAPIARANDRAGLVDARLPKAIHWLKEFSDAWHAQ